MDVENENKSNDSDLDPLPLMTVGNEGIEYLFAEYNIDNRQLIQKLISERERECQLAIDMNQDVEGLKLIINADRTEDILQKIQ